LFSVTWDGYKQITKNDTGARLAGLSQGSVKDSALSRINFDNTLPREHSQVFKEMLSEVKFPGKLDYAARSIRRNLLGAQDLSKGRGSSNVVWRGEICMVKRIERFKA
jgi:hypothetical protein